MITRIEGLLDGVEDGCALVKVEGGLTYAVLVPAFAVGRLGGLIGRHVQLHTVYYIESQNQGVTMTPRLAGFLSPGDRAFFELLTTVKGIGRRKALRAMTLDTGMIAEAIAGRDAKLLQSLPEIGKRTAETIVAELSGKVDGFVGSTAGGHSTTPPTGKASASPAHRAGREALEALVALGENRAAAAQWIDAILRSDDPPTTADELVARVYAMRAGG